MGKVYPNLFEKYQPRKGRGWVRDLPAEERRVFVEIGLTAAEHGHLGGVARAAKAKRDLRGRFTKGSKS